MYVLGIIRCERLCRVIMSVIMKAALLFDTIVNPYVT